MRSVLLNKIAKKEQEPAWLYSELKDYVESRKIPNKEVREFIDCLFLYIEYPTPRKILKQFIENDWIMLDYNQSNSEIENCIAFEIRELNMIASKTFELNIFKDENLNYFKILWYLPKV